VSCNASTVKEQNNMTHPPDEPFKLSDARIGQRVVIVEPIEDEVRWKHLERRDGAATYRADYVPVVVLRAVQGRAGQKPRWDSGELRNASEMPGRLLVIDAKHVNHDWTEAHHGLMIVESSGWIGFYINSKLVHTISPSEWPCHASEPNLAVALVEEIVRQELADIPIGRATAEWNGMVLPYDLTKLKLTVR
jgi:hypothetical protein